MIAKGAPLQILIILLLFALVQVPVVAAPDDLVVAPRQNENAAGRQFQMNEQQLEANLFRPHGNSKQARDYVDATLNLRVNEIHRECQLTDQQRDKLMLAAANDMSRFFDQADALLRKYKVGVAGQMDWNNFWIEAQPLQRKLTRGLFGDSSFFEKAIPHVLNDDQEERYEQISLERRRFRYRSMIEASFVTIENSIPLQKTQQEEILNLLLEETQPPKLGGHNGRFLVLYRMSQLPEDKVKPILKEHQWRKFKTETARYKPQLQFLVQQGELDEDELKDELRERKRVTRRATLTPADAEKPENNK